MKKLVSMFVVIMIFFIISSKVMSQHNPKQIEGILVDVRCFLAGYFMYGNFSDTLMSTYHLDAGVLPTTPLNKEGGMGYSYPRQNKWMDGRTPIPAVPDSILLNHKISSYIQVELRKNMTSPKGRYFKYGLLTQSGQVLDLSGANKIRFTQIPVGQYYLIIHQANHLTFSSREKFDLSQTSYIQYDFTTGLDKYFSEYIVGQRRLDNEPAVEIRPGVWASWGGDPSGSGENGEFAGDDYNDFSDQSFIYNMLTNDSNIYNRGDINQNCRINDDDLNLFNNWSFRGSYVPFIVPLNAPVQNRIIPVNSAMRYRLTAENFTKNGDTVIFSVHIIKTDQDTLLFRWAQLMLKLNYNSASNVDTMMLECPIANSQIFLSQGVVQIGMMSNSPIEISNTAPYELAKVRIIFKEGTCPAVQGLLNWTTTGLRTKIFAQINTQLVDITNHESHFINDSIVMGIQNTLGGGFDYTLSQNYPNPFNPLTVINFSLPRREMTSLKIYNINGREISILLQGVKDAGYYTVNVDGNYLSSGIYFYKLVSGNFIETKRMMLIK